MEGLPDSSTSTTSVFGVAMAATVRAPADARSCGVGEVGLCGGAGELTGLVCPSPWAELDLEGFGGGRKYDLVYI